MDSEQCKTFSFFVVNEAMDNCRQKISVDQKKTIDKKFDLKNLTKK